MLRNIYAIKQYSNVVEQIQIYMNIIFQLFLFVANKYAYPIIVDKIK